MPTMRRRGWPRWPRGAVPLDASLLSASRPRGRSMPDQAAGLRSLFTRRRPSLLVVAGSDPAKAAVAVHFAREAAAAARATLLVDGTAGQLARACDVACRHELAHVVAGDVALSDIARPLTRHLLLLPAARALARVGSFDAIEEARLEAVFSHGIAEAFATIGVEPQVDLVVVHAEALRASQAVAAFGRDARVVIVASGSGASLRGAYAEMKALVREHGHRKLRDRDAAAARRTRDRRRLRESGRDGAALPRDRARRRRFRRSRTRLFVRRPTRTRDAGLDPDPFHIRRRGSPCCSSRLNAAHR